MKAIINRKRYDTETAITLASCFWGESKTDDEYIKETIYVTKTGNYFMAYEGGPNSRYSVYKTCDTTSGSIGIKPLTRDEAYDWLENHECVMVIEKHFGDLITEA